MRNCVSGIHFAHNIYMQEIGQSSIVPRQSRLREGGGGGGRGERRGEGGKGRGGGGGEKGDLNDGV